VQEHYFILIHNISAHHETTSSPNGRVGLSVWSVGTLFTASQLLPSTIDVHRLFQRSVVCK